MNNVHMKKIITINVPLILKMREIIFFLWANYFMGHFEGYFEGAKTFLTLYIVPKPLKISREMAHKLICPKTKNNISNFQIQRYIGNFISHCNQLPTILNHLHLHIKLSSYVYMVQLSWQGH
jgi:hypothetical protein